MASKKSMSLSTTTSPTSSPKQYTSDDEQPVFRKAMSHRDRTLDKAWEMRRTQSSRRSSASDVECKLLVRPRGRASRMCMDMEEVKACRDLGLALPADQTVEISGGNLDSHEATLAAVAMAAAGAAVADGGSGGSSPMSKWEVSNPGDDPNDVKARLKLWAQAVALSSSGRHS